MATLEIEYRGTDLLYYKTVMINDIQVNIATLTDLYIVCYHKFSKVIVQQFSLNVMAGYDAITIIDAPNGIVSYQITDAATEDIQTGVYVIETKAIDVGGDRHTDREDLNIMQDAITADL